MNEKISYSEEVKEFYKKRRFDRPTQNVPKGEMPEKLGESSGLKVYQGKTQEKFGEYIETIHSSEARKAFDKACQICEAIKEAGGKGLIVGGAVRDEVLGAASKDFDIEVYGIEPQKLEEILNTFGKVKDVGKAFGILKLGEGAMELDFSMPRIDSKIGDGHRGFEVKVDPNMSIAEAAKRRDFTFNALCKDPLTGEIFDPYGGVEDLRTRTLRVTDPERFRDDPLRLFRAAQFVGRFGLSMEPDSMEIMKEMVPELKDLSRERIREEWNKLLLRSIRPSMGLTALNSLGVLDAYYPELAKLRGTEQEFEWHPEGDVWIHTLMVTDAARNILIRENLKGETARIVMLSALCHDLGKPATTELKNGKIVSHAHDVEGMKPAASFLERIGTRKKDKEKVVKLVKEHLWPSLIYLSHIKGNKISDGAFRKLAQRLSPATLDELSYLSEADNMGTGPFLDPNNPYQFLLKIGAHGVEAGNWVRKRAEETGVLEKTPEPAIKGRELIGIGFESGHKIGKLMKLANECHDSLGFTKEEIWWVILDYKNNINGAIKRFEDILKESKN